MVPIIQDKIKRLESFQNNVDQIIIDLVRNYEPQILDMNTDQLWDGKESTGQNINPPYHPLTIKIKTGLGQPVDRVTLKDTGDFHHSFYIDYYPSYFVIWASDPKETKLVRKYGRDIFGLTDGNIQNLIDLIRTDLCDYFRKLILS